MILVLSTEQFEESTEQVLDWLEHFKEPYIRLNGEALSDLHFELDPENPNNSWIEIDHQRIFLTEIKAVWYRRTGQRPIHEIHPIPHVEVRVHIAQHLLTEMRATKQALYHLLSGARWLSHPQTASPNKMAMLQSAHDLGMAIPPTKILTRRASLESLRKSWGSLIIKCISDCRMLNFEGKVFNQYTASPDSILNELPERFFPTLVQGCIEKQYEIRTFYFRGKCYSMAIFSQGSDQTSTDFRVYNYKKRSRTIPYQLPEELETKIHQLMQHFQLETGSLDFMVGKDGQYYFLEINPVGQFGMVSYPCNYKLEQEIAQYLKETAA